MRRTIHCNHRKLGYPTAVLTRITITKHVKTRMKMCQFGSIAMNRLIRRHLATTFFSKKHIINHRLRKHRGIYCPVIRNAADGCECLCKGIATVQGNCNSARELQLCKGITLH